MTDQIIFGKRIVATDANEIEDRSLPREVDDAILQNLDSFDRYLIYRIATANEDDSRYSVDNDLALADKNPRGITKIIVDTMMRFPDVEHNEADADDYITDVARIHLEQLTSQQRIVVEQMPFPLKQSRIGIHPDYIHTTSEANTVSILYDLLGMVTQAKCDADNVPVEVIGPIEPALYDNNTYGGLKLSMQILHKLTDGNLKAVGRQVRTKILNDIEDGILENYPSVYTKSDRGYRFDQKALTELSQTVKVVEEEFSGESNCLSRLKRDTDFMDALAYAHTQTNNDVEYLIRALE